MSPHRADPVGSIGWTERTGGVLTLRGGASLAREAEETARDVLTPAVLDHSRRAGRLAPFRG